MLSFVEYDSAVALKVRLRNASRQFWDFVTLAWVGTENANTYVTYGETAHGDGASLYTASVTLPSGGPFVEEAFVNTGEEPISSGIAFEPVLAAAVAAIPTNPLLANDTRLDHLDADVSVIPITDNTTDIAAIKAVTDKVGFTGTGPYLVNSQVKGRDNLDFGVAEKASLNAATPASVTGGVGSVTAAVTVGTNNDKTGYSLSTAGVLAIWNQATAAAGILVNTCGAKIRDLVLGTDNRVKISADAQDLSATLKVDAKVVEDKTGYALTAAYDAAKTAASQTSVNAIPTTPLLSADTRLNNLNAPIGSIPTTPLLAANYTAPDNTSIGTILTAIQNATYGLSSLDTEIDAITIALAGLSTNTDMQTLLSRLTSARALLVDNLQYLTQAPGLTSGQISLITEARDEAKKARQFQSNKAVISPDGLTVTIYADDDTTPLWVFSIPDNKHRIPA